MEEYFDDGGVGDDDNPDDIFLQDDVECDDLDDALKVLEDLHLELWTVLADAHLATRVWTEPSDDDEFIIDEELRCVVMGNPVYGAQADLLSSLRSVIRTLPQKRHRRR